MVVFVCSHTLVVVGVVLGLGHFTLSYRQQKGKKTMDQKMLVST